MTQTLAPTGVHHLANGMRVLTRELHHAPLVSVMVWYGVGSRNERPGLTGLSHFLEHMMFKGTARFPYGALEEGVKLRGGMWNAFTSYDYTAYFEVLPSRHLEYGLQVEADRMVNMTFDPDLTVRERGIIVSEREGRENSPHYWLFEAFMEAAYQEFPYRHAVLGYKDDIRATTAEALTEHYRRYYRPRNATLVVAGDMKTDQLLELAARHFGGLPPGEAVEPLLAEEPEQQGERRVTIRRPGPNPYLMAAYKIPGGAHPDQSALTILGAVLSGGPSFSMMGGGGSMGRSSRFYGRLVNTGIATSAGGSPWSLQYPGLFLLNATPVPGISPERLEAALFEQVESVRSEPVPEEELARAKKQVRAQLLYGMESAINQAVLLGSTAVTRGVEWFDRALERFDAVTAADLHRVARQYLAPERRIVGWFLPGEAPAVAAPSGVAPSGVRPSGVAASGVTPSGVAASGGTPSGVAPSATASAAQGDGPPAAEPTTPAFQKGGARAEAPVPGARGRILDTARIARKQLPGGATLLVYPASTIPSVLVRVQVEAGAVHDPAGREGLAQLTAQLLSRGSSAYTAEELALKTDALGMSLRVDVGRETAVATLKALPEDLPTGLALMAEVLRRPTFPEDELSRMRERLLVGVREANNDTRATAGRHLAELLYPPGHPYREPVSGTEASLPAVSREDLIAFHDRHYGPEGAVITVVGDVDPAVVHAELLRAFEGWTGGTGRPQIPAVGPAAARRSHVTLEGKSQMDIAMGWPMVDRAHPDYLALEVLATLFGGNGTPATSRLFRDVREKHGLSYYQFASFGSATGPGAWSAHIGVNPARLEFAIELLQAEIQRLAGEPAPQEELSALKSFLQDFPAVQLESPERLAGRLAEAERFGLGLDYPERYPALVAALTAEQLQEVAARHLRTDRLTVVTAGPALIQ